MGKGVLLKCRPEGKILHTAFFIYFLLQLPNKTNGIVRDLSAEPLKQTRLQLTGSVIDF